MLRSLGITSAAYKEDFDALFVPFRSVASDVLNKKSVVFRSGNLNEAIRASITYPLYINPIKIDGKIYFDGGLYNNFPENLERKTMSSTGRIFSSPEQYKIPFID